MEKSDAIPVVVKVDHDVANNQVNSWLRFKCVSKRKRNERSAMVDILIDALVEGDLVYNEENHEFTQHLQKHIGTKSKLVYQPRCETGEFIDACTKNEVKSDNGGGRVIACVSVLTSLPFAMIKKMDPSTDDFEIASAISLFFM